jgi:hypothetical protein
VVDCGSVSIVCVAPFAGVEAAFGRRASWGCAATSTVLGKANSASNMAARAMRFLPPVASRLIKISPLFMEFCFMVVLDC